eukprot:733115-Pyramimonas_sp.AAC.1
MPCSSAASVNGMRATPKPSRRAPGVRPHGAWPDACHPCGRGRYSAWRRLPAHRRCRIPRVEATSPKKGRFRIDQTGGAAC